MDTREFIEKAKKIHGDKYDYSKVEYINAKTKVCIICPEHGEFWQVPSSHLAGCGCPKCNGTHQYTTKEWIERAKLVHGDKYDYSKVKYIDSKTKVCIICPEHGEFWQQPTIHLTGVGCPKCARMRRSSTAEEFINKAHEVHGNKYDYSKVEYKNNRTKICIICPEHGEFWTTPDSHLAGCGCPKCAYIHRFLTAEEFINKAHEVHGNKYDYSKVEYKNNRTKVCIICPEHGEFWQLPSNHLKGQGCPKCAQISRSSTTEKFIKKAHEVHGDKYDYSKVEYVNSTTKVCIICPEHGEFWKTPSGHINKLMPQGCPKCALIQRIKSRSSTTEDFIKKACEVHGDKYDYSKVEYVNSTTKVCIICPEHGEFWQLPSGHLSGAGCPKCAGVVDTDDFIEKAKKIHGDKYDYSKVEYINAKTKVCIICPEHGEFWQKPTHHLDGVGCPKCAHIQTKKSITSTAEEFIKKAHEVHGNKYDYSKVEYKNNRTKVCIICPEHGEFWQLPSNHLKGQGCPNCAKLNTSGFIEKAKKKHGDKYDYSKVEYKNSRTQVCIICPEHGEFWQTPSNHLKGQGCPNCQGLRKQYKFNLLQEFISEYELHSFLKNNDVNILYVILRNIEPRFEPIKDDIEKALMNIELKDPIQALEDKYAKDDEDETEETSTDSKEEEATTVDITNVDLDDDDAVNDVIGADEIEDEEDTNTEPTIEDVVKNTEKELEVISKIEHMLTPEDREYIMEKFKNDKLRYWMANRETSSN